MLSSTMTPKQLAQAITGFKRSRDSEAPVPQRPAKKRRTRARRSRNSAPGQVITSHDVITQRTNATNSRNTGAVRLANTEYLFAVAGGASGTYTIVTQTLLQPRVLSWAKNVAQAYSLYKFSKVKLVYKPVTGTTTSATVAFGFFSDPADGNYWYNSLGSLSTLSQAKRFTQGPAYSELCIELDPSDFNSDWFYQSNTDVASDADRRLTAAGNIATFAKTNATTADAPLGNMYIEYELIVKDPVPFSSNV